MVRNLSFVIPIYLLVNNKLNYKFYAILFCSTILITLSKKGFFFFLLIYLPIIITFFLFQNNKLKSYLQNFFSFIFSIILFYICLMAQILKKNLIKR